ncbi:HAMP domain-containing sensor histidine kinase [Paenibacillus sp. 19GGS1-52]|uniref:HAMP domain-containing sensor histidine kinase n=1 Tax=Paenibacillus sp. 19GGS1-52 TaxID=2758563 RepID=UPI001EFBAD82|nr:HAMP domain-containing sensor histidine kinase [Paenibacillus sp. 19GGS1-52]ULO06005.1 HAMP domain-containing sensor histidine kinase [Paenibacillus sp. 19GGS1-52]
MGTIFSNTKWMLSIYFLLSGGVTAGLMYAGSCLGYIKVVDYRMWVYLCIGIVLFSVIIGYMAGQRIQRRVDHLDLNMLQVAKGNLSVRMPESDDQSFARVYHEFNSMMDTVENKMQLLQRLGEQEVIEKEQAAESAVLEERRRMARDLHDTVSQQLFAIHMSASSLPKVLERNVEQGQTVMNQLITMSQMAQKQMRALIAQLRPVELEGRTLFEALEKWFPDYCRQNGLKGMKELELQGELSEAIEHQLFLIIQEAMANIVKHAIARIVSLSLRETPRQVVMSISDDGQGFENVQHKQGSYGLTTMRERAEKLGGQVEIISRRGAGTTIRVHIPKFLQESHEPEENGTLGTEV